MKVKVVITKYISDDPQPGIVECHLSDAQNRDWTFIEKTAVVSTALLNANTKYPVFTEIACRPISKKKNAKGREIFRICTDVWFIESTDGVDEFDVFQESLILEEGDISK